MSKINTLISGWFVEAAYMKQMEQILSVSGNRILFSCNITPLLVILSSTSEQLNHENLTFVPLSLSFFLISL